VVVSLAVPESFDKLLSTLAGLPAFAVSFGLLAYIWYAQYSYFRRYDFEDAWVVILNLVLLFVVLVYVYPLKFLYAAVFSAVQLSPTQGPLLFVIYGAGFAAVFALLALLYLHAYRSRISLAFTELQTYEARAAFLQYLSIAAVGILSAMLALALPGNTTAAGFAYFLIALPAMVFGTMVGRRRRQEAKANIPADPD
jgi:uncharacterized membrane protein